jgi:hypothetical protein
MKPLVRISLVAGAAVVALTPAFADHSWGNYHWAIDGQRLNLVVNHSVTAQWTPYVNEATADWDESRKLSFSSADAATDDLSRRHCRPIRGQIRVCNQAYGQRTWIGIASIWLSGNHIVQGTTQLNDSYFDMPRYNTPAWRLAVTCQEIAHDFGLDHQDETFGNVNLGSCMDYSSNPAGGVYNGFDYGPSNERPNDHDFEQISAIYSHDDGFTTTVGSAATNFGVRQVGSAAANAAMSEPAGLSPAEWGRAIGTDGHGRPNEFVKELGPGLRRITHVTWTPDAKVNR